MEDKIKVNISGYYGFDNSGDDAILKAIVKDLRQFQKNIEITAFSNKPESTEANYHIRAVNRFNIIQIIKELSKTDMLISGGGSLLQDVTSTRSILYYLALIYIAKLFKKPVMVYANGIGPIYRKLNRFLTRKILNKVDLITLRDFNSKQTLDDLGVMNKNVYVTSDPVFTLEPASSTRVREIFKLEDIPIDKKLIGISIRDWNGMDRLKEILAQAIDYMVKSYDVRVILIPMHYPEDLKISEEIKEMTNSNCIIIRNKYGVEEMMGIINHLELIVAMRLHSLIYASTQAIPMIGLVYDPKVQGFMNMLGLDTAFKLTEVELVDLCTTIDKTWTNRETIKRDLSEKRRILKKKAIDNIDMAIRILKEGD